MRRFEEWWGILSVADRRRRRSVLAQQHSSPHRQADGSGRRGAGTTNVHVSSSPYSRTGRESDEETRKWIVLPLCDAATTFAVKCQKPVRRR
jgi:hypothetical protein